MPSQKSICSKASVSNVKDVVDAIIMAKPLGVGVMKKIKEPQKEPRKTKELHIFAVIFIVFLVITILIVGFERVVKMANLLIALIMMLGIFMFFRMSIQAENSRKEEREIDRAEREEDKAERERAEKVRLAERESDKDIRLSELELRMLWVKSHLEEQKLRLVEREEDKAERKEERELRRQELADFRRKYSTIYGAT